MLLNDNLIIGEETRKMCQKTCFWMNPSSALLSVRLIKISDIFLFWGHKWIEQTVFLHKIQWNCSSVDNRFKFWMYSVYILLYHLMKTLNRCSTSESINSFDIWNNKVDDSLTVVVSKHAVAYICKPFFHYRLRPDRQMNGLKKTQSTWFSLSARFLKSAWKFGF